MKNPNRTIVIRVSLTLAILASTATAVLNFVKVRSQIHNLQSILTAETDRRVRAEQAWAESERREKVTALGLEQAKAALQTATAAAAEKGREIQTLKSELVDIGKERDEAQASLAQFRSTITIEEAVRVSKVVRDLRAELAGALEENSILGQRVAALKRLAPSKDDVVTLPADLRCKVLVYDPKWNFIVVDAGLDHGMLERAELLVSREGKFVGKVKAVRVEKNRCVANLLPGSQVGEVHEGDVLIPAYPES